MKSPIKSHTYRSEGFALTGYDIPGCMEDGAWMLWENSSAVAVAVVGVAHPVSATTRVHNRTQEFTTGRRSLQPATGTQEFTTSYSTRFE